MRESPTDQGTDEGVIKFRLDHKVTAALPASRLTALRAWHRICHRLDLLGRDPGRYGGFAYGNISQRSAPGFAQGFVISGTQTAGRAELSPEDYAEILDWDVAANRVGARGPCRPSSESITHGMIYDTAPPAGFVVHAHSPEIWSGAARLGLAATAAEVAYGTPEMARAVRDLFETGTLSPERGVFVMLGHEDGVVSYGSDPEAAGSLMVATLARAFQLARD
jgi:hypothetical protein